MHPDTLRSVGCERSIHPEARCTARGANQAEAGRIVDDFVDSGGGDVVDDLAGKLPLWTICEMMGVPDSIRGELSSPPRPRSPAKTRTSLIPQLWSKRR